MAAVAPPADLGAAAQALGEFLAALHVVGPPDGPRSPWRGMPLAERDVHTRRALDAVRDVVDVAAATEAWERALAAAAWPGPDVWLHGDLHPANILVDHGRLSAVLDFGDLAVGDPATDLVCGWMLFGTDTRPVLRSAAGADDATWARGRGWALSIGLACLASSADNPVIAGIGRRAVDEVLADRAEGDAS
jgi:aminoglycoside phosphotransferase (APT) family kinase protein